MLLSSSKKKGLLSPLLWAHKMYDIQGILPYKFSKKQHHFQLKSPANLKIIQVKLRLVVLFTLLSFLQTLHIWKAIIVPQLLQCWFYLLFSSCGCYTLNEQLDNGKDIVALLKGMLLFERNQIQGKPIPKTRQLNIKLFTEIILKKPSNLNVQTFANV